jgi:hypothetical protein
VNGRLTCGGSGAYPGVALQDILNYVGVLYGMIKTSTVGQVRPIRAPRKRVTPIY